MSAVPIGSAVQASAQKRALAFVYVCRSAGALAWVAAALTIGGGLGGISAGAAALIAAYPVLDAAAVGAEIRVGLAIPDPLRIARVVVDMVAAGAVALMAGASYTAVVHVFGVWAFASGAIQINEAVRRLHSTRGQWLMIISGAGSVLGGFGFLALASSTARPLDIFIQYSVGGTVWYVVSGASIVWFPRRIG